MYNHDIVLGKANILVDRLARLSADSIWARRASGLRASLDKAVRQSEIGDELDSEQMDYLINLGFQMLEKAGKEISVPEDIRFKYKEES